MSKRVAKKQYIVRTYSAGVFAGEIVSRKKDEVVMRNARRLWRWAGAASLSQLAMEGVKNPADCKFPVVITTDHVLLGVIEIIEMKPAAVKSVAEVPVWGA